MPNPITNFRDSSGLDLGNKLITKEYLMSVYPQIANQLITPELWVWGLNSYGRLGNNNANITLTPITTFAGGANWKQVAVGYQHTAAIKTDGTLWTWGNNGSGVDTGALGAGTLLGNLSSTPITTFAGGTNWKQVACFQRNTAAIKTDGTLWIWGQNYGRLGNNDGGSTSALTPITTFAGGTNWKQVACGTFHNAAIKTDGTLWTWGANFQGRLGVNDTTQRNTPVTTFAGGNNWKQVYCSNYTAAIKTDGTLWVWGLNGSGQLGLNDVIQRITPVTTFAGGTNWKQVVLGSTHTVAIKIDGTLWNWGNNNNGQLGINDTIRRSTPVTTFAGGNNWKQVTCNTNSSLAIKTDGTLWGWGSEGFGDLGANTQILGKSTPITTFAGGTNWKQVSGCSAHIAAIKTSDDLQGV